MPEKSLQQWLNQIDEYAERYTPNELLEDGIIRARINRVTQEVLGKWSALLESLPASDQGAVDAYRRTWTETNIGYYEDWEQVLCALSPGDQEEISRELSARKRRAETTDYDSPDVETFVDANVTAFLEWLTVFLDARALPDYQTITELNAAKVVRDTMRSELNAVRSVLSDSQVRSILSTIIKI